MSAMIRHNLRCRIWLAATMQSLRLGVEDVTKHRGSKWSLPQGHLQVGWWCSTPTCFQGRCKRKPDAGEASVVNINFKVNGPFSHSSTLPPKAQGSEVWSTQQTSAYIKKRMAELLGAELLFLLVCICHWVLGR